MDGASRRRRTLLVAVACAVGLFGLPTPARAQPAEGEAQQCVDAHIAAQRLRRDGKPLAAKQQLLRCSSSACPSILVKECGGWLAEVEHEIPSVVFEATGPDGSDVTDFTATVDGARVEAPAQRPLQLDPGEHRFQLERAGAEPVEQRLVLRVGDDKRRVAVRFVALRKSAAPLVPPPPPGGDSPAPSRPMPVSTIVLGGLGLAGIGTFAAFAVSGLSQKSDLASCKGHCTAEQVDDVRRSFLVGDVALAIGVVALGAAVVFYAMRPEVARAPGAAFVSVGPARGGAAASIGALF